MDCVFSGPAWDCGWKGVGRKPYDARALTVLTIWQDIEGKPERVYTADLERDKKCLQMLGLEHAPHITALYRTRKRLSEKYMEKLNRRILERLKPARKVSADATGSVPVKARLRMVFSQPKRQKGIR